ncbi:MAG: branched-chain amino acid ABC transporter substrate-binding protein [Coriobacteriia bacterium]|jgi:branched-chain amino acid transport system substrate-binding protein|nr:branched-chain amino acid ABC transporter substrate-binding protein [Coriobacteriia bacterium]
MQHPARRTLAVALVTLLLATTALVGCGSEESRTPSGKGAPKRTRVKIGLAAPLTGDNAVYGQGMKRAADLALKEANDSEEVRAAGYEFVLRAEDDQGDPKQAVNVANLLAGDAGVVGVIGHFNSGCTIPASAVYEDVGIAMITVSSNPQITTQGFGVVNRIVARDDAQGAFAARLVYEDFGHTRVAVVDDSTPYGQGLATEFVKTFADLGGEVIAREAIQTREVDFSALVTRLKSLEPQAVYYAGAHTEGALLSKQMSEADLDVPLIGGDIIFSDEYIAIAGADNAEGDVATILGLPLDQQARGQDFRAAYEAEYGQSPEAYDSYAYDAAAIFVKAVLQAGPERIAVIDAVRNAVHDGVTGTTEFDENGDTLNQAISAYRVTKGAWVQITE